MAVVMKKKRVNTRKTHGGTTTTMEKKKRAYRRKKELPRDLIIEILKNLLTRALLRCGAISKLWYTSIHNDKHFICSHFLQSQKGPNFMFTLLNVKEDVSNPSMDRYGSHFFRFVSAPDRQVRPNVLIFKKINPILDYFGPDKEELVGWCNGLPCVSFEDCHKGNYTIYQPNRGESFYIIRSTIPGEECVSTICHGFGFDSLANEYKLVNIYRTADKQFNSMVFTLGTKSWRCITTTCALVADNNHHRIQMTAAKGREGNGSSSGCLIWKRKSLR